MPVASQVESAHQKMVNKRIKFIAHYIVFSMVVALVAFTGGLKPAIILGLSWGIGLASHGFSAVLAPMLRQRWAEKEPDPLPATMMSPERRVLEGRHARSLEELSASIAHEIRNPITAAKSLVAQMGEDPSSPDNVEYARVALEELDRVERSIAHLLRFARDEEIVMGDTKMSEIVDSALESFRDRFARGNVVVKRAIDTDGAMRADAEKIRRVVINLVQNALDALEEGSVLDPCIEISAGENLAGTEVWLRVRDNGAGIPPERLPQIFQPFYTSKKTGTGLGLAVSKKIADAHGGSLEAFGAPGTGTEMTLTLPKGLP
ncbi:ATP-binding protein [Pendulispora brunnea]|uniref:histidine kinase n=1 Tax=Pendulispora brunnea TaxID=2905690 RepID=A0ABZ2K2F1_9BACT